MSRPHTNRRNPCQRANHKRCNASGSRSPRGYDAVWEEEWLDLTRQLLDFL